MWVELRPSTWSKCFLPVNWRKPGHTGDTPQGLSLVIKLNGRVNKESIQGWQRTPPQPFLKEAEPTLWCPSVASAALGVDSHPCEGSLDHHLLTSSELPSLQARYPPPSSLILYMYHVRLPESWWPSSLELGSKLCLLQFHTTALSFGYLLTPNPYTPQRCSPSGHPHSFPLLSTDLGTETQLQTLVYDDWLHRPWQHPTPAPPPYTCSVSIHQMHMFSL